MITSLKTASTREGGIPSVEGRAGSSGVVDQSTLAELRKSVTSVAKEVADIAEQRGRVVRESAEAGTATLRRNIRRYPLMAMGSAGLAGALLAYLVVPRGTRSSHSTLSSLAPSSWAPPVSRADLYDIADSIQRTVARATSGASMTSSLERLADAFVNVDAKGSLSSAMEKAGTWFGRMQPKTSQHK